MFLHVSACSHILYVFKHRPVNDLKFTSASGMIALLYLCARRPMCGCEYSIGTTVALTTLSHHSVFATALQRGISLPLN